MEDSSRILSRSPELSRSEHFGRNALHVWVLFLLAVTQPIFGLLSGNGEFLIIHRCKRPDVIALVFVLCILIPAVFVLLEFLLSPLRKAIHATLLTLLITLITLYASRQQPVPGVWMISGLLLLSAGLTLGYYRMRAVPLFFTYLWPALILVPGIFLYQPVVRKVLTANEGLVDLPKVKATTPVVMVIFDQLPITSLMDKDRKIDSSHYQNFARLAQESYWFRNATTVSDETYISIPAILTGDYPRIDSLPWIVNHPHSLFTLLGGSYEMNVFDTITRLWPKTFNSKEETFIPRMKSLLLDLTVLYLHMIVPSDLANHLPQTNQSWGDYLHEKTPAPQTFERFLQSIGPKNERVFHFLYCSLPHPLFQYIPSGKRYWAGGFDEGEVIDEWGMTVIYQRLLLQVGFVDRLLGRLIDRLKAVGLYDDALIVITADHGICYRADESMKQVTQSNYADVMPVPLFIKAPHQKKGIIIDKNVETIDIFPTIAEMLGIAMPWRVDGRSIWDDRLPERKFKTMMRRKGHDRMEVDPEVGEKWKTLEWKLATFGSGGFPDPSYSLGSITEVLGHPVEAFSSDIARETRFRLDHPEHFEAVDQNSDFVPAAISGRLLSIQKPVESVILGVAVNGIFRALTRNFDGENGENRFAALVSESSFHAGNNKIQVFLMSQSKATAQNR